MNCTNCNIPEGHGYILPANHFDGEFEKSIDFDTLKDKNDEYHHDGKLFKVFPRNDKIFLPVATCHEMLESTGDGLCDNIAIDEPLHEIKLIDGLCKYCQADKNQPKLFAA